ncbi:hypothetical protein [Dyadobacter tibetensis]|uniref:hypothetical protein n=1 Tax=Dyadobacter tibetensis TaxID=1211851 RepID=UPI00046FD321|nr:hypothetical protein [Dyadobacter tibetensis]
MESTTNLEVWLRGPITDVPALLQPVAHALLQSVEELEKAGIGFPSPLLWERPCQTASVGFHLQHLSGILDRLFTYARGESLNENQLNYLKQEGHAPYPNCSFHQLFSSYQLQVEKCLDQLKTVNLDHLTDLRYVGRAMIPSTQIGLLFHAAEHAQRHVGQLIVTARILRQS